MKLKLSRKIDLFSIFENKFLFIRKDTFHFVDDLIKADNREGSVFLMHHIRCHVSNCDKLVFYDDSSNDNFYKTICQGRGAFQNHISPRI